MKTIIIITLGTFIIGCAATPQKDFHSTPSYQQREEITASLFSSDAEQLSNEAASQILNGKLTLANNSRAALLKLPSKSQAVRYYGYNYWRSEDYMDLQQRYVDILAANMTKTNKISSTVALPSFITSKEMTLPQMREAAVRLQAHLLVIYKLESDTFHDFKFFKADQVKAYATCEMAVLDTKTGIIPFTEVITKKHVLTKKPEDADLSETRKKAEIEVSVACLQELGESMASYIEGI